MTDNEPYSAWREASFPEPIGPCVVRCEPKHDESCGERCNHCEVCGECIVYGSRCPEHYLNQQGERSDAAVLAAVQAYKGQGVDEFNRRRITASNWEMRCMRAALSAADEAKETGS